MKSDRIIIGNIKKCTKFEIHNIISNNEYINEKCIGSASYGYFDYEEQIIKENAILIKLKNGGYVDIENLNSFLDYIIINGFIVKNISCLSSLVMSISPLCKDCLFVDEKSLKPYYSKESDVEDISIRELKKNLEK